MGPLSIDKCLQMVTHAGPISCVYLLKHQPGEAINVKYSLKEVQIHGVDVMKLVCVNAGKYVATSASDACQGLAGVQGYQGNSWCEHLSQHKVFN